MFANFTDGQTIQVKEETSDFDSAFGLERIPITKHQNYLNDTNGKLAKFPPLISIYLMISVDNESELKDTKEKLSNDFFKDYLLNQRPEYYGDTSYIMSKSRKLYY